MSLRIPPLVQVLICGAIGWGLSSVTPFLAFEGVWRSAAALLFIAAGMAILALALGAFIRARTTVNPLAPEEAATLVTTGLYRISRNPMYLAMAAILTGGAFLMGNLSAFVAPILFVWLMTEFQIKPEERALQARCGEAFDAYRIRTRRWI